MKCPRCGGRTTYVGVTDVECETADCANGPEPSPVSDKVLFWGPDGSIEEWVQVNGVWNRVR